MTDKVSKTCDFCKSTGFNFDIERQNPVETLVNHHAYISASVISLTDLKSLMLNVATSCIPCAKPILMISKS